jgi:hypothetical protein
MMLKHVPTRSRGRGSRYVAAAMAIGALGILLAACSSAGSASTTSTTTASGSKGSTAKGSTSAAFAAYTKCLSQHGVTLPNFKGRPSGGGGPEGGFTPGSGGGGTPGSGSFPGRGAGAGGFANNPKYAAAEKACASLRPKGGGFGFGGRGANSAAFAAYTNCLKLHGVTVTNGVPDRSSSAFATASAACAALRPTPGSTTSTTAPTASG